MNPATLQALERALSSAEEILAGEWPLTSEMQRVRAEVHVLLQTTTTARIRAERATVSQPSNPTRKSDAIA
jgi:hypothetical protein